MLDIQFTRQDAEICSKETVYQGFFQVNQYTVRHKLFAGGWTPAFKRDVTERLNAVGVILHDPLRRKVVLVEQFRPGLLSSGRSPWLLEIVAGLIDADETPETVIQREAQEEAGVTIQTLQFALQYWVSPGASSQKVTLFYGTFDSAGVGGIYGLPEEHEDIRVHVVDADAAYAAVNSGLICNSLTIIALQWLQLHEQQLQEQGSKG